MEGQSQRKAAQTQVQKKVQKIFLQIFDQTSFDLRAAAALLMMDQLTRNNKMLNFINEH